jgi:hypothetical protein
MGQLMRRINHISFWGRRLSFLHTHQWTQCTAQVATAARTSVGVAGLVLDFACLRNTEEKPCGPAIIKAIADGGLQGVLTKGTKDGLNMQQVRAV